MIKIRWTRLRGGGGAAAEDEALLVRTYVAKMRSLARANGQDESILLRVLANPRFFDDPLPVCFEVGLMDHLEARWAVVSAATVLRVAADRGMDTSSVIRELKEPAHWSWGPSASAAPRVEDDKEV